MAQRDIACIRKETTSSIKQRPSSIRFQTSLSQPESKSHGHSTLPVSPNNNYAESEAERYILSRAQMLTNPNEHQDISPESPSSITETNFSTFQSSMGHAERMYKWRQKQTNEINKKQKYRYVYGPRPSSSNQPFSSPVYFTPSVPLSSQRKNTQPSISLTHSVKNDNSRERSKKIEPRNKFTAV